MSERIEAAKGFLLWLVFVAVISALIVVWIAGAKWVSEHVLPFLSQASAFIAFVDLILVIPIGLLRFARKVSGWTLYLSSYLFGITLWMYGLLMTLFLWGTWAVAIGLFLAGVGVVPIAYLASLFKAEWSVLANLVFLTVATFGARALGVRRLIRHAIEVEALAATTAG